MTRQLPSPRVRDTSDLPDRLDRISLIVKEDSGQLDRRTALATERLLRRAGQRLRLAGDHTVVALAGGTGSGKSSLFNALAGLELSQVGVRRPTTAVSYACVWGGQDVSGLLDWLDVPKDRRVAHESELDDHTEVALRGLVLLDLPDHDSIEASHQLEVDRLIDLVDVLVWVLDPQKYADAIIHERYLRPLRTYADVMMVVLNQADRLDPGQAQSCLQDLRRMLGDDGLGGVRTMLTSARSGVGVNDLRAVLTTAVASRQATARRISADLDVLSVRLGQLTRPDVDMAVIEAQKAPAAARLTELAGVDRLAAARASDFRIRGLRRAGWPLTAWRHRSDAVIPPLAVPRAEVDAVARGAALATAEGMPEGWQQRIQQVALATVAPMADQLDEIVRIESQNPIPALIWWRSALALNWLLLAAGAALAAVAYVNADGVTTRVWIGVGGAAAVVVLGIAFAAVFARLVNRGALTRQSGIESDLRAQVAAMTEARLANPLRAEIEIYNSLQQTVRSFAPEVAADPEATQPEAKQPEAAKPMASVPEQT